MMHAALSMTKRENPISLLTVVPATAPRFDEITDLIPSKGGKEEVKITMSETMNAKTTALEVLSSALGNGSGTDEITRRERSAFGAATQALNEEENTRRLKVYMNEQILPKLKNKLMTVTYKYRIWLAVEIILAIFSMVVFGVMAVNEAESEINSWLQNKLGVKVGLSAVSLGCTFALLFASRSAGALKETVKRMKREITKRETYNHIAGTMAAGTERRVENSESRVSNHLNAAWINAPGTTNDVPGWQLVRLKEG
uniref:NS3 n=1 Tax=Peruvian horse sickness virus TaxID=356862 RepID=A0A7M3TUI2_9REOV|nr:NS3 [Peruvian horse sickness virus]